MAGSRARGEGRTLVVASYNVHAFVGNDGRRDALRIAAVLDELGADVVALQEVRCSRDDRSALELLARRLGASVVRGLVMDRRDEGHGNAVLSRLPLGRLEQLDLSVHGHEPRGAIDVTLETGVEPLRLIATHLGIGVRERRLQVRRLVHALARREPGAVVLLGDMNEWVRGVGALLPLHRTLGRTPGPRTFPASLPLFSLDRIWVTPRSRLHRLWVHRSALARRASDHLPILAELAMPEARGTTNEPPELAAGAGRLPPSEELALLSGSGGRR
jgi:endonuclease/exonuclease/phosphatase family metal-dependent hydrolase